MQPQQNQLTVPVAIVLAGIIIAGGIFFSGGRNQKEGANPIPPVESKKIEVRNVETGEHVLGNPQAKLALIEYSDPECPFCKRFHETMNQIMDTYGKSGDVAWVYRHFPLDELHPKARKEAEATECATEQGGNQKFWEYIGKIFEVTPSNNGLDPKMLPKLAKEIGIDSAKFQSCLDSGKYAEKVNLDYQDGAKAGVSGTPHTVIVAKTPISDKAKKKLLELFNNYRNPRTGELLVGFGNDMLHFGISGAMPFQTMKATVDILLANK